jgi:CheY-like chemotaxis protein
MYQEYFESEGVEVYGALSAIKGLEILNSNNKIQVIISDSHMPGMGGLEFLAAIQGRPNKPLFYLATGDLNKTNDDIKNLGGTGLIMKPFDLDDVVKRIAKDLHGQD